MQIYIFLIISFLLSLGITFLYIKIAKKKKIMDIPNARSSHAVPIPRGGGIVFVAIWYLSLVYLFFTENINSSLFYALMSGIVIVIVGFIDDIYSLSPKVRLLSQFFTAGLALYFLVGFQKLDMGFYTFTNEYLLTTFALLFIVWMINLFNFLDGIDGYVATESILILVFFSAAASITISLYLAIPIVGFLIWNWQKAKVFMGDVGSTLIGFTVAVFAIYFQNTGVFSFIIALIATTLLWFDATYTVIRRKLNHEKLSEAHRKHLYQRLVRSGYSHQKVVLFLPVGIGLVFIGLACLGIAYPNFSIIFLLISIILMFFVSKFVDTKFPFEKS